MHLLKRSDGLECESTEEEALSSLVQVPNKLPYVYCLVFFVHSLKYISDWTSYDQLTRRRFRLVYERSILEVST
ncbi:hypothetical protein FHG87_006234 [Trinorchestia longiramus]|nr:hypothetical protein FHG87_006234 [Trinorchestia longiramus]